MKNIIADFVILAVSVAAISVSAQVLTQDLTAVQFRGTNSMYTLDIQLGNTLANPNLKMLVDTGSIWTWVISCDTRYNDYWELNQCPNYFFDASDSKTIECEREEVSIDFNNQEI